MEVKQKKISLIMSPTRDVKKDSLTPFMYKATIGKVDVFLAVGLYRAVPDEDEVDDELKAVRSSEEAGWTIVCNDRVVLYNDRTILTGWGEADVPKYHTQFINILGVVFFNSNDPKELPLTTTKRSVETSSKLYLYVKNQMRDGLKKFTDYTNYWKTDILLEKENISNAGALDIKEITKIMPDKNWSKVQHKDKEYKLNLPLVRPANKSDTVRISFSKKVSEVEKVKDFIFGTEDEIKPSDVGLYCFDEILKQANQ
jgi:hypothetical protein